MTEIALVVAAIVTILIVGTILILDQRQKRQSAEQERDWHELRAEVAEAQVPFPYGEKMP